MKEEFLDVVREKLADKLKKSDAYQNFKLKRFEYDYDIQTKILIETEAYVRLYQEGWKSSCGEIQDKTERVYDGEIVDVINEDELESSETRIIDVQSGGIITKEEMEEKIYDEFFENKDVMKEAIEEIDLPKYLLPLISLSNDQREITEWLGD